MQTPWDYRLCPEYGGVCTSQASAKFPVGVAMHTHAVECYEAAFKSSPLLHVRWPEKACTIRTSAIMMYSC